MAGFPTNVSGLFGGGGGGGGSSSGHMVPFLAGMGFRHFADTIKKLHSTVSGGQDPSKNPNIGPGQTAGQPMSGAAAQPGGGAAGIMPMMQQGQRPMGPLNPMSLARLAGLFPGAGAAGGAAGAAGAGAAGAAGGASGVVPGGIAALLAHLL